MAILRRLGRKKGRKYPAKWDEEGRSARQRCFKMFEDGVPMPEIVKATGVTKGTVATYHKEWKKHPKLEAQYAYFKGLLNTKSPDREPTIDLVARYTGIQREELETMLQQPHGLRRMMMGKFYFPVQADADHKRYIAMELAVLISDHLINSGGKFEDVRYALERLMKQHQKRREQEDKDIEEENQRTALMRRILEVDLEKERRGRIQPDRLSDAQRDAILRQGTRKPMREAETLYWSRIAELIAGGLTKDQARQKLYQDLVDKNDIEGAKLIRELQE